MRRMSRWEAARRQLGRGGVRALAGTLVLVALLWVVAATGLGMSLVVPAALGWAAPEGWTVEVGSVDGAWHSRLRLRDLRLEGPHASASIEDVSLDYRLLPLLSRAIELQSVRVLRPELRADLTAAAGDTIVSQAQGTSGGLDILVSGSPLGDWTLALDHFEVRDASASLLRDDGVYSVSHAVLIGGAELVPSGVGLRVDTLRARITPPEPADSVTVGRVGSGTLVLAAHLEDGLLDVRTLSFESPRSSVSGSGELLLAPVPHLVDSVDFRLVADPLDLRDLPLPVPDPWADEPRLTVRIAAHGAVDSMVVDAELDGPAETAAQARAIVRTPTDTLFEDRVARIPSLELTVDARGDLAPWLLGPLNGDMSARVDLRLDSLSSNAPGALRATLVHRPSADTLGGMVARDLRLDVDLTFEGVQSTDIVAGGTARSPERHIEATTTLYGAARASDDWREIGALHTSGTTQRADWRVDLEVDSGSVAGRGSARWAGERVEVVVDQLAVEDLDASAIAARFPVTDVTARLEGNLGGTTLDDLSGVLALDVSPSTFATTRVESAALRARVGSGAVGGAVMADAAGRRLSSDFEITLADSLVSATLTELRIVTPMDSADTGRTSGDPDRADAAVGVTDAGVADSTDAVDAAGAVADAALADTTIALPDLEVRGSARGTWSLGAARRGTFSLTLDSALVAGFPLSDGSVTGRLVGDSVSADASLRVHDVFAAPARVDASLSARGSAASEMIGRLELTAVRAPGSESAAQPTQPVAGRAAQSAPDAASAASDRLVLTVTADTPGRYVIDGGFLPAEGGGVDVDGMVSVASDSLTFEILAAGGIDTPTSLLREVTIDTLRLDASGVRAAGAWDDFRAGLLVTDAGWRGVAVDTVRMQMSAEAEGFVLDTLWVESEVLTLAAGGTLPARGRGAGKIDVRASVGQLDALREVVEAELPEFGDNVIVATVSGSTDSLEVTTQLEVAAVSYRSIEIADVSAEALVVFEPPYERAFGVRWGAADLELDAIALPETDVQNVTASLSGSPDSLLVEVSAIVDGERAGELVASIDPRPDARLATLDRFHLKLDEDDWELAQPARVSYGDGYSLRGFHLVAGDQAILADGGVTGDGALDLSVQMDSTDVGTVTDLLNYPRLDGWLGGTMSLEGTVDAPRGTADLSAGFHVEGRQPTTLDVRLEIEDGRVLTDAELRDPAGGTLTVDGSLPLGAQGAATADTTRSRGSPGAAESGADALDLSVRADAFDVSSAVAFVDSELLATLDGRVDATLEVAGSPRAPSFRGPIALSGGSARLPELGVTWEGMWMQAHGEGNRLVVDSARVEAGPGYLSLTGNIIVDESVDLDLAAYLQEFQAIQSEEYRAVVSGDLRVGGTVVEPVVGGDLRMESLDVYIGESDNTASVMDVELSEEDLQILRDRFGYMLGADDEDAPLTDFLTADLTVELSRDSWLRKRTAPEMAVAFSGEVEVQLRPQEEPRLQGTVTTIADRGYIQQFGKRFELREGTVTLDGPPDSARVALSATYVIPSYTSPSNAEATIVLSVEGTQDDLALTLSSEPPMENADIVSYVATGRPAASNLALGDGGADQAGADSQGGLTEAGAGIALNQIVGAVERAAREGVGLDVVEIRREGIRGATLVAGKYLSPRLYVGFAQPVTHQEGDGLSLGDEGETEVEVEYQALKGLLLNIEGSDSALRIFLRGRLEY